MVEEYTKEEMWDVYEKLPENLQEAVFAPETAEHIRNACRRAKVKEDLIPEVANLTGQVLMGLLTPTEFKKQLKENLKLNSEQAKNLYREINRFVFMPVRETLSALYGVEIEPTKKPEALEESDPRKKEETSKDEYREPIK